MKQILTKVFPIILLIGIFFILFYKVFLFGQVFYNGDNFHLNIPEKYFFVQQVLHGHLPLWNPYIFLGVPYLADLNLGTLNPTNVLYFIFPVPRALTLLTVADFMGLSIGMYLLLRSFHVTEMASFFGSVMMSLSGMPFALLSNMTLMQVIVYIPFIFFIAKSFCEKKTVKYLLLLILLQFLQLIAGHPQITYYTMFFISLYILLLSQFSLLKKMGIIFFYILSPLLLSSIQLLPFLEYVQHANRPGDSIEYAGSGGITLPGLVTFIFPTFYGSHANGTWWGPQQILMGFLGIPSLVFLFVGMWYASLKNRWFYIMGFILSFLLALGKLTPLFYFSYYLLPGWKLFRDSSEILVFFTFFGAILVAFGFDYVRLYSEKFVKFGKKLMFFGLCITILFGILYFYANRGGYWKNIFLLIQEKFHWHFLSAILFYDAVKIQQIIQGILWNVCYVGVIFTITFFIISYLSKKPYQLFLILLISIIGFFIVDSQVMLLAPISYYSTGNKIPTVLSSVQKGKYRILSLPVNLHQDRKYLPSKDFFFTEGQENLSIYQVDNNIQNELYQIGGYTSLVPQSFATFIHAKDRLTNVTGINFTEATATQLNLSSVGYIITNEPMLYYKHIPLQLVDSTFDRFIYKNSSALQRAYVLEDPKDKIFWKKITPLELYFSVTVKNPEHIIVTDWYYPGWKAFVNGKEVHIGPFLGAFREIFILPGLSNITFIYDPMSVKLGLWISIISFICLIIMYLFKRNMVLE